MKRLTLTIVVALLAQLSCVGADHGLNPVSAAQAQLEAPFGLESRRVVRGLTFPFTEPAAEGVRIVRAFPDLSFTFPLYVATAPDDDSRLYVVERGGLIQTFPNSANATNAQKSVFLDLRNKVKQQGNEEGLLGLAFHPNYASNGYFYVYFTPTYPNGSADAGTLRPTQLWRYRRSADNHLVADPDSGEKLLQTAEKDRYPNHQGGCMQFGPDGKLYLAVGDEGSHDDPNNNSQNLGRLYGKLLRLNDDGSVPADNPFVGMSGKRGEIWAYGLRNPWRFSFDRLTGKIWLGDVGQDAVEEVNVIRRGGNYGWRLYEGDRPNDHVSNPDNLPASAFDAPVFTYRHDGDGLVTGQSITGGYVYRGSALPSLQGQYLFADFVASRVWALSQTNGVVSAVNLVGNVPNPASFGQDNAGNLYIASFDGHIYTLAPEEGPPADPIPPTLSATGLFRDLAQLTPTRGLIEYEINAPFWSDGTIKRRWIALPGRTRIGFAPTGAWRWPQRSVIVKHFEIDLANGTRKRLETRVLINTDGGWRGYTYRWNEAGTDANLIDTAQTVDLVVADADAPGGARTQTYEFPDRGACLSCHTAAAGYILGLRTPQMNRDHRYPRRIIDNQLRALNHIGLFRQDIGDPGQYSRLATPTDTNVRVKARARAYLDSNCSQCHRPGGPTPVEMDLRAETPRARLNVIGVEAIEGAPGTLRVDPGSKETSLLWQRMNTLGEARMPPIASHAIDRNGVALIGQWIDAGAR